jgi:hypothetical protein
MQMLSHDNTGNSSEVQTRIAINGAKYLCFNQWISQPRQGQVLVALAEIQFTNSNSYNVGVWSQIRAGDSSGDRGGPEITEANGRNITPDMHHDTHTLVGTWEVDADYDWLCINVWAWAGANGGSGSIDIDQDYGRLSVMVFS